MKPAQIWQLGDYATVGRRWAEAGDVLARELVRPADRVLDVACGPGSMAIGAAASGATVTGLDISPTLLDTAKAHAARANVSVEWVEHDMTTLPFADGSFDRVLSAFGAMFAPDPVAMARELRRVCAPGGTVAVLAWTPESAIGRFGPLSARYLPPDRRGPAIDQWGVPDRTVAFFDGLGDVRTRRRTIDIVWPSHRTAVDELTTLVPGWIVARSMLSDADWSRLTADVGVLLEEAGETTEDGYALPTEYLATYVTAR